MSDSVSWSEEHYRTLFDLGPVAVYSCDASGVIQKYNRLAVELWGREPLPGDTDERFCGSFKLFRPDGHFMPHHECPMAEVVAGVVDEVRDAEVIIEQPDNSRVTVVVNIRPVKNDRGDILGAINCFYDITARKKTEELLLDSDRRKNELLATLAHELRTPLAPIRSSIEVMRRVQNSGDGSFYAAMNVLDRQVGQMVRLVDDLLDTGRISRGKLVLRTERVELSSVVYHAVESVQTLCDSREQHLIVTLPETPVYVTGDPTRLAQIVSNLLNNAIKFTHCGGHVFLTVERDDEAGSATGDVPQDGPPHVLIRVRDTGRGIAADQLLRIFDLFGQVDTTLERSTDGLGIGLTLVRALAHMHGGTVDANSAGLDCGSEFIVRLPMLVETPIEATAPIVREPAVALAPLRILVVDDNRDAADMLATLLRLDGHDTQAVHDGRDAVDATLKLRPDLVLLDIGLPRLSGYDVARIIREQGTHEDCPFLVAVTGWGQTEDRRRTQEAGFDAHLVKPVSEVALRALAANVGRRIQQREMPA